MRSKFLEKWKRGDWTILNIYLVQAQTSFQTVIKKTSNLKFQN